MAHTFRQVACSVNTSIRWNILTLSLSHSSYQMSVRRRPATFSITMYSEPTGLFAFAQYLYTNGVGTPCLRTRSIVATSLEVARNLGCVEGYGRRAIIRKPSRIVTSNTRLKPPSANLRKDLVSSFRLPTDSAAAARRADTLNVRCLSSSLFCSLYLERNEPNESMLA
ncbi:hypothetical protein KC324_g89 [Hortaea werneckii]|nr:hypothetical protein KC324_g89 [Hortaea werneckii]